MKTAIAFVLLLAVAGVQRAAAWEGCVDTITGETTPVGTGCPAAVCVDHTKGRVGMITKVNIYEANGCIVGVKPTYGFDAKNARLIGKQMGSGKHIKLSKGEFITKMEVSASGCIKALKLSTNKGRSVMLGSGAMTTYTAPADSYLYAFKGCTGVAGCSVHLTNLVAVWAKDVCQPPAAAVEKPSPSPSPVVETPVVVPPPVVEEPVPPPEVMVPPPVVEEPVPPPVVESPVVESPVVVPPPVVEVPPPVVEVPPPVVEVPSPALTPTPPPAPTPVPPTTSSVCEDGDIVEGSFPYVCVSEDKKVGVVAFKGFFKTIATSYKCYVKACPATPSPSPAPVAAAPVAAAATKGSKGIVISFGGKGRKLQSASKGFPTFAAPAPKECFDWCKPKPKPIVISKPVFTMKGKGL